MLIDLTRVSGQRVAQVDEYRMGRRFYIRTTTVGIALGGLAVGLIPFMLLQMLTGSVWPILLVPACGVAAVVLFARRRSDEGEQNARRIERMVDRRRVRSGMFILPGQPPFRMDDYRLEERHTHVI